MNRRITLLALCALIGFSADAAQGQSTPPNRLTPAEQTQGWRLLFDGKSTRGWAPNTSAAATPEWQVVEGCLVPPEGPVCWYVHTTAYPAYEVTGECWTETRTGAMLALAKSLGQPGKFAKYASVLVSSSGPTEAGKWTSFRVKARAKSAQFQWKGQAKPEELPLSTTPTHFQLGYFGPGKVRFRNLKIKPIK